MLREILLTQLYVEWVWNGCINGETVSEAVTYINKSGGGAVRRGFHERAQGAFMKQTWKDNHWYNEVRQGRARTTRNQPFIIDYNGKAVRCANMVMTSSEVTTAEKRRAKQGRVLPASCIWINECAELCTELDAVDDAIDVASDDDDEDVVLPNCVLFSPRYHVALHRVRIFPILMIDVLNNNMNTAIV